MRIHIYICVCKACGCVRNGVFGLQGMLWALLNSCSRIPVARPQENKTPNYAWLTLYMPWHEHIQGTCMHETG